MASGRGIRIQERGGKKKKGRGEGRRSASIPIAGVGKRGSGGQSVALLKR